MATLSTDISHQSLPTEPVPAPPAGNPVPPPPENWKQREVKPGLIDRIEAFVSKLSTRDNFWHRICSLIWLPLAFFSGIRMKKLDAQTFGAYLPFTRFNRNWYRAMAGGALLGNAEIAGGMYVFGMAGGEYTVVCKNLHYTFLRPCLGPALYKMTPRENLKDLIASKTEFNITLDMEVVQQSLKAGERERRVGKADVTFHVTPKVHHKRKRLRNAKPTRV
jgi:acyl-coenzyme A thioesterase PaaI-like protein